MTSVNGKGHVMAVYTEVGDENLIEFIANYDIGEVLSCKGIAEGIENSNFALNTSGGHFILTLYEKRVAEADLPFFIGLMDHLAERGIACPLPVKGRNGTALHALAGRPAAIISFLEGLWVRRPKTGHCQALGAAMAQMHLAGHDFPMRRANALSLTSWRPLFDTSRARADTVEAGLADYISAELDALEAGWPDHLASGVIHADLFPDNVFFLNNELSGLIDFYFACNDMLAYDIAICLNAWCFETDGSFNITKARHMLSAYRAVRPVADAEIAALPLLCRGSALRFLLTRLYDLLNLPEGALVTPKDPLDYLHKLRFHQDVAGPDAYGLD